MAGVFSNRYTQITGTRCGRREKIVSGGYTEGIGRGCYGGRRTRGGGMFNHVEAMNILFDGQFQYKSIGWGYKRYIGSRCTLGASLWAILMRQTRVYGVGEWGVHGFATGYRKHPSISSSADTQLYRIHARCILYVYVYMYAITKR